MHVRDATLDDVAEIARIHVDASGQAERGLVPDAALDAVDVAKRQRMWQRILGRPEHPVHVLVAEADGRVVGFAACGPAEDGGDGEVHAVYVEPGAQGRGHGSALMDAAEDDLRGRGYGEAVLWVLPANTPTVTFYRRRGWNDDGAERVEVVHDTEVRERRWRKRLR